MESLCFMRAHFFVLMLSWRGGNPFYYLDFRFVWAITMGGAKRENWNSEALVPFKVDNGEYLLKFIVSA